MNKSFHSNGKLLLTGEYVVLDGAIALAIPTKYGQSLHIEVLEQDELQWISLDELGLAWFEESFALEDFTPSNPDNKYAITLSKILREARNLNPDFLKINRGLKVKTTLDFPRNWGLGTSSTLINNIAQWAKVDGFTLLNKSFGGSGYDIAAAQNNSPILYQITDDVPKTQHTQLPWKFKDSLHFVHLNKKQDSKQGISHYRNTEVSNTTIQKISAISNQLVQCASLTEFEKLINLHEKIISKTIQIPTIKSQLFHDYPNAVKSLGAWGGDFVLVTGTAQDMAYFKNKGFNTVVPFEEMSW